MIKLSVVISCFNNRHIIEKTIDSSIASQKELLEKLALETEIIVFDNASTDGSAEFIKKTYPQIKLVENKVNIGFSKGNNSARPYVNGEYILFLNGDTEFKPNVFVKMLEYFDGNKQIGVATCKVDLFTGGLDKDCRRGEMNLLNTFMRITGLWKLFPKNRFFNGYYYGHISETVEHEVFGVQGAFLLTRKELADKIGWWDEDYFLNGEDLDFCQKIHDLGFKIMYYPAVKIIHYRGYSKGTREVKIITTDIKKTRILVAKSSVESMKIFYKKHLARKHNILTNMLVYFSLAVLSTLRVLKYKIKV
ncbi:MAG: glycosyltransferase family 2 protein [bacterium]|nr:glycosyltransferase family 2 protein [bacterium]